MFNRYMWDLYIQSGGDKVVEMFRRNLAEQLTDEYAEEIARMRKYYCINDNDVRVKTLGRKAPISQKP